MLEEVARVDQGLARRWEVSNWLDDSTPIFPTERLSAKLAEAQALYNFRDTQCQTLRAEVRQLREALTLLVELAENREGSGYSPWREVITTARAALQGGGMGHALPDQQCK